jgi:hypothetical protein
MIFKDSLGGEAGKSKGKYGLPKPENILFGIFEAFLRSRFYPVSVFPRKRESSFINPFWASACAGAMAFLAFYETIKFKLHTLWVKEYGWDEL